MENERPPLPSDLTIPEWLSAWLEPGAAGHFSELQGSVTDPLCPTLAPAWSRFFQQVGHAGLDTLDQRMQELQRQVRDNGITYNVYADPTHPQRPWSLDLFPLLMTPQDWQTIAQGVQQRVRLLENILADVYGPQRLLREALIPAALVQGHPGFLRAMQGITPVGETRLHIAAFDLARSPEGHWWVVSQRTQAPSGLGYMLENRSIISRLFPQAYEAMHVQRLSSTYQGLLEGLRLRSPAGADAHIALLTPGPFNETYFEQAYLARYLGVTLVQGHDLTVRDQRLYLNTLRGLEPVHGLIKRLDDEFLDPLALRADSTLGIPGLMQAIRAGNVIVANAPGSAFLESPALLGFLPALSQALLGETLQLPSLHTWWCGERAAREEAQHRLSDSVIKPTFPWGLPGAGHSDAVLGRELGTRDKEEWAARIAHQSDDYTIQTYLPLSQMPTWHTTAAGGRLQPRSVLLRVFAIAQQPGHWQILPGGLARLAVPGMEIASMQRGGSSADVWVPSLHNKPEATQASPVGANVPEVTHPCRHAQWVTRRAAENLYWLGRYSERCFNILKLVRFTLATLHGEASLSPALLRWLQDMVSEHDLIPPGTLAPQASHHSFERLLIASLGDTQCTSLGYHVQAMRQAASAVRERLSPAHWQQIERMEKDFFTQCASLPAPGDCTAMQACQMLANFIAPLHALSSMQDPAEMGEDGWRVMCMGREMERLGYLCNTLALSLTHAGVDPTPDGQAICAGLLTLFNRNITSAPLLVPPHNLPALLAQLVQDRHNPDSLAWVAQALRAHLAQLAGCDDPALDMLARTVPGPGTWDVSQTHIQHALPDSLKACGQALWQLSDAIRARYFMHIRDGEQSLGF